MRNSSASVSVTSTFDEFWLGPSTRFVVSALLKHDEKSGCNQVVLVHESPEEYDSEFIRELLIRATESILSSVEFRETCSVGSLDCGVATPLSPWKAKRQIGLSSEISCFTRVTVATANTVVEKPGGFAE